MTFRALVFWVSTVLLSTLSSAAIAQTATPGPSIARRDGRDGLAADKINYEDCILNDTLKLTLTLVNASNLGLEVWAGTSASCAKSDSRAPLIGSECWLVFSEETVTTEITLRVQDIVFPGANGQDTGTADACTGGKTEGNLTLYFVLLAGDTPSAATPTSRAISYDLKGPSAPKIEDQLGIGETRLYPKWALSSANDVKGYKIYCEKTGLTGTTADSACESTVLKAGDIPSAELAERGTTGPSATSGEASGLENYQQYACAVSAYDDVGNAGPLSDLACGEPQLVLGYFKGYRAAGGQAGGGYCSFSRSGPGAASGVLMSVAALGLLRRRSRQRGAVR